MLPSSFWLCSVMCNIVCLVVVCLFVCLFVCLCVCLLVDRTTSLFSVLLSEAEMKPAARSLSCCSVEFVVVENLKV
jgi:hypothetical protein